MNGGKAGGRMVDCLCFLLGEPVGVVDRRARSVGTNVYNKQALECRKAGGREPWMFVWLDGDGPWTFGERPRNCLEFSQDEVCQGSAANLLYCIYLPLGK